MKAEEDVVKLEKVIELKCDSKWMKKCEQVQKSHNFAHIHAQMTALQKEVHGSLLMVPAGGDCFDMWRDYMNLGGLLQSLRAGSEMERRDGDGPKQEQLKSPSPSSSMSSRIRDPSPSPTSPHPPTPSLNQAEYNKHSDGTSSSGSLSDRSYSSASSDYCGFCKQNRESPDVYRCHRLKAKDGKVTCPILRKYTCVTCGASGDYAHTRRYCPQTQQRGAKPVTSVFRFW